MTEKFSTKEIGGRLRTIRKDLGNTLEEMAQITGLSKSGISDMEKGLKKPSSVYMSELYIKFGVNINWVLTGKGTTHAPDIEFDLNFGKDNELIKKLIFCIENIDIVRYDILKYFAGKMQNDPEFIDSIKRHKDREYK